MEEKKCPEIPQNSQNAAFSNVNASQPQPPQYAAPVNVGGAVQTPQQVPFYAPAAGISQPAPKRRYTAAESVFAWLCLILGYLFIRVFLNSLPPLGTLLFVILLYALTFVVVKLEKARFSAPAVISLFSGLAMAFSTVVSGNGGVRFFAFACSLAAYTYFVYTAFGNKLAKGFTNLLLVDFFKSAFILPFASFGKIFHGLIPKKGEKCGTGFLKVLIGIALAFIPCVIIIALLFYDESFRNMFRFIKDIGLDTVVEHIVSACLGIPVAMYVYGLLVSSKDRKCANTPNAENCRVAGEKTKIAPVATVLAAVIPISLIYVIFFISQWKYYVSGFVGALPSETSYAEYARSGFFQLTAVAFINFVIIALVGLLMKRDGKAAKIVQKAVSVIFSLMTLVLISTAAAKMIMYIDVYGLTPKRVYASWFICVLAVLFLLVIIKQFAQKLRLVTVSALVVTVMFAGLAFSNIDGIIARYNVERYMNGSLSEIDVVALIDCGDSAVPALADYVKWEDEKNGTDATRRPAVVYGEEYFYDICFDSSERKQPYTLAVRFLYAKADAYESDNNFFSASVPVARARKALEAVGIKGVVD